MSERTLSREQINDLWEAIHPIPAELTNWGSESESLLILYLSEYSNKWKEPNLLAMYTSEKENQGSEKVHSLLSSKRTKYFTLALSAPALV